MSLSLEEQRRALLEQIEASRAIYRRMLTGEPFSVRMQATHGAHHVVAPGATDIQASQGRSPAMAAALRAQHLRTQALQWATEHPLWVAGGVALLVLLVPRVAAARRARRMGKDQRHDQHYGTRGSAEHGKASKAGKAGHAPQTQGQYHAQYHAQSHLQAHAQSQAPMQGIEPLRAPIREVQSLGVGRALLTVALLLLRDPARLKAASRLASLAWRWLQRRRAPPVMPSPVTTESALPAPALPVHAARFGTHSPSASRHAAR